MISMGQTGTRVLPATDKAIAVAAEILATGGLVAFPTETVYGLGADARNGTAVARIYAAKGRPQFNPLIVHVPDLAQAERLGEFNETARRLVRAFWPGALTLVVPMREEAGIASLTTAGLDTIALRVPAHRVAQALLRAAGRPIAAPSANPSGRTSPTLAAHVAAGLDGRVDLVLDGGPCGVGLESTIVGTVGDVAVLLRSGGTAREDIEQVLGAPLGAASEGGTPTAPGQLLLHYAPATRVRLDATDVAEDETLLAFGPDLPEGAARAVAVLNLSEKGDTVEAAANLFAHLHELDRLAARAIAVMPIPETGLGEAINDRLRRAAVGPSRST